MALHPDCMRIWKSNMSITKPETHLTEILQWFPSYLIDLFLTLLYHLLYFLLYWGCGEEEREEGEMWGRLSQGCCCPWQHKGGAANTEAALDQTPVLQPYSKLPIQSIHTLLLTNYTPVHISMLTVHFHNAVPGHGAPFVCQNGNFL